MNGLNFHLENYFLFQYNIKPFTYGSTDNFLSLIPVCYWLTFCYGNLIPRQKRNENDKYANFMMKNKTKQKKHAKKVFENMK